MDLEEDSEEDLVVERAEDSVVDLEEDRGGPVVVKAEDSVVDLAVDLEDLEEDRWRFGGGLGGGLEEDSAEEDLVVVVVGRWGLENVSILNDIVAKSERSQLLL